jgi:glycosyltransferase involved in cell wall biosynthesis
MLQRHLWRRGRGAFSAIVCCSSAVQRYLEADGISTHGVIWPGVRESPRRPPLDGPPTVTFAGRLAPEKGVDVLVRAFRLVRDRVPEARLLVAGSGPAAGSLGSLVAQLELGGAVELLGQLDMERVAALFGGSWVHAVPSRWPEPFGLTASEAMMRGTAVVASDVGGLADIVQHGVTGLSVPAGDVEALARALIRILSDRSLAEQLGAAARVRAREAISLTECTTRFEALYESLLHPQPVGAHVG